MLQMLYQVLRDQLHQQQGHQAEPKNSRKIHRTTLKKMYLRHVSNLILLQVEKCKAVIAKKDYYEILGLAKTATEDELKKAYKKMALKFHPDKNRAPNATDAFKKISTAFACLNNADKRRIYDQHGTEENFQQRYHQQFNQDQFDPDDIFRMFFGGGGADMFFGGGPGMRRHQNGGRAQQYQQQQQPGAP